MAKKGQKFKNYPAEFKIEVVEAYLSGKYGGVDPITKKYDLKTNRRVCEWLKIYKKQGPDGFLYETRGRISKGKGRSKKLENMTLEEQVEFLKMEVDILKKVRALQEN